MSPTTKKKPSAKEAQTARKAPASATPARAKSAPGGHRLRIDSLDNSIGYSLRRAQLSTYEDFLAAMLPFDIRPSQFAVLVLIRSHPGLSQSVVCSILGIQKTNFVALLDTLELRGLTERREAGSDRRSFALHLTLHGEAFVETVEFAHAAMEKRVTRRLGAKRTRELLVTLHEFTRKASHRAE
jgi:DNA-binding MarR family transcriptional regulator